MPFDPKTAKIFDPTTAKPFDPTSAVAQEPIQRQQLPISDFSRRVARSTGNPILGTMANVGVNAYQNIIPSASNFFGGIAQSAMHPIQTAQGAVKLLAGGIEKATGIGGESVQNFDAFLKMQNDRYGTPSNIANTMATDPVGFLADASTVLSAGGGAMSKLGSMARVNSLAKAGEIASVASGIVDPVSTATGAIKVVGGKLIPKAIPQHLYQSSAKLSTTLSREEKIARISTGLKEGIPVSNKGFDMLRSEIDNINSSIGDKIKQAKMQGVTIPSDDIVKRVDDLRPFFENTINPQEYLSALDNIKKDFVDAHGMNVPIDKAQKIKQNTYVLLRKAYNEMKSINVESQKAVARGIKEEIAKRYPEINSLNARESALIGLEESIGKAIGRIDNKDIIGIGTPIAGAAGASLIGEKTGGVMIGMMKSVIDNPYVKSKIAIALDRAHRARMNELLRQTNTAKLGSVLNSINGSNQNTFLP